MWEKKGSGKSLAFLSLHVGIIREDGLSGGAENSPPPSDNGTYSGLVGC